MVDRAFGPGILGVEVGGFEGVLRGMVGGWVAAGERRVLMAGMVGSRQGWVEAAYVPCPADARALGVGAVRVGFEGAEVRVVPGVSGVDGAGVPEVMRGEEVQVAGLGLAGEGLVCLPGTHSKWVRVVDGEIAGFTTHMTGEVFGALRGHTILGRLMAGEAEDRGAFLRGVARSGEEGGLLHHVFGVRALGLMGGLGAGEAGSYLSGVLIGHEVRAAGAAGTVHLVGEAGLCGLYAAALGGIGVRGVVAEGEAAVAGLMAVGAHVEWGV